MIILYLYLATLFTSFCCSLLSFRLQYAAHLKLFSIFLGVTVVTEFLANFMVRPLGLHGSDGIYSIFILLQVWFYFVFFLQFVASKKMRKPTIATGIIYTIWWIITVTYFFGLGKWNSYISIAGDIIIVILCAIQLYKLFTAQKLVHLAYSPEFWITSASMFYFACEFPITGTLNYAGNNMDLLVEDLKLILRVLNIIMYLCFIYAFICPLIRTNTEK